MKDVIEKYKDSLETFRRYALEGDITTISDIWNRKITNINKILKIIENGLTPELFDTLESRDKWDVSKGLIGKVHWYCKGCGEEMDTEPESTFGEICCDGCDFTLTRRTGGGMSDPFGWTFKWNNNELRKFKLKALSDDN